MKTANRKSLITTRTIPPSLCQQYFKNNFGLPPADAFPHWERQFTAISCSARLTEVLTISTRVPTGTLLKTRTISRERMRMQP